MKEYSTVDIGKLDSTNFDKKIQDKKKLLKKKEDNKNNIKKE